MKITVKQSVGSLEVEIPFTKNDTLATFKKKVEAFTAFELETYDYFSFLYLGNTLTAETLDTLKSSQLPILLFLCTGQKLDLKHNKSKPKSNKKECKDTAVILLPAIIGVSSCVGLSVAAGLVSLPEFAVALMITSAVGALIAGVVGSLLVLTNGEKNDDYTHEFDFSGGSSTERGGAAYGDH